MDLGPWTGYSIHIPKHTIFPLMAVRAMDCCILSCKYGLQHQAHRPHDPALPSAGLPSAGQTPMVSDVEPVRLHPGLVLHDEVGAINSTTHLCYLHALFAADPDTSQPGAQHQQFQRRHAELGPRT